MHSSEQPTDALVIEDLHFRYGGGAGVRGVSLRLSPGDCYGFLGHNGAGKTTVMRLCLGLLRPERGRISVFGLDVAEQRRRAHALLGAVIETPGFWPRSTARESLVGLARLQGIARANARRDADRVLELTGLLAAADRRVATFSMGMRQRLGIAQALLGRPRLLLLDEPTTALDPEGIAELRALLLRLTREENVAVLLSSHQLAELEGLCNRVGVLREGAMVVEGDLAALRRRFAMRHVITGRPLGRLAERLRELELLPVTDGDRLLVDLDGQPAAAVVRALADAAELSSFAPEQATLERIYLQAGRHDGDAPARSLAAAASSAAAREAETEAQNGERRAPAEPPLADLTPELGTVARPRTRVFGFEARALLRLRVVVPLLLPAGIAVYSVFSYAGRVEAGLALVAAEERFSADAGSGFLAVAQGLQLGTPALALVLVWLSSQSIAAELSNGTLRNALVRSVRRLDLLVGKLMVLGVTTLLSWSVLVGATAVASAVTLGFGDLEEVTRYGDRDLLVAAADVWPTLLVTALQVVLPLLALVVIGLVASVLARRPALALATAMLLALVPEVLRSGLGDGAGWLLTSHLPVLWRDDSALGYLAATSRGAADALWPFHARSVTAPLLWLGGGIALLTTVFTRLRIR